MPCPSAVRHAALLATVAAALLTIAPAAGAKTFTVASMADGTDTTPADGICQAPCSLRAAIQTANGTASAGPDTIVLPAGTYVLSLIGVDGGGDPAATGDLDLTDDIAISGAGQAVTTIDAKGTDRVFDVAGASATISDLTITGGAAKDGAGRTTGGGARVGATPASGPGTVSGALSLSDVTMRSNVAADGAALATDHVAATLALEHVSVLDNTASGNLGEGGAISERDGGSVTISGSLLRGNVATSGGAVVERGGGSIRITDSVITANHATAATGQAGGVYEAGGGSVTITRSIISANSAAEGGGVVEDGAGRVAIVDSTIAGNSAAGAAFHDGGGILQDSSGRLTISGSTISANTAVAGAGLLSTGGGTASVVNTTFSANHADERGGAVQVSGAGTLTLTNATLADNQADGGASSIDNCSGPAACGTIAHGVSIRNTIVAGGAAACAGAITSAGHNLDSGVSCGFASAGDRASVNALLGPLTDNDGPTLTHAELDGSPAIDAGDPAACPATDQRGSERPLGAVCDIGAYERAPVSAPPAAAPQAPAAPAIARPKASDMIVLPSARRCLNRGRLRLQLRAAGGVTVTAATIRAGRAKARTVRGAALRRPLELRGPASGRFTLTVTIRTSSGQTLTRTRRYRACAKKR